MEEKERVRGLHANGPARYLFSACWTGFDLLWEMSCPKCIRGCALLNMSYACFTMDLGSYQNSED